MMIQFGGGVFGINAISNKNRASIADTNTDTDTFEFGRVIKFCQSEIIFILVDYSFVKYPGHSLGKAFEKLHFIKGDTVSQ